MGIIHRFVFSFACRMLRIALSFRYRIRLEGFEEVLCLRKKTSKSGILFLPNHPAEIDPILLTAILGPYFQPRSVVVEHFYRLKGFQKLLDFSRVIPVPSMSDKANKWKKKELDDALSKITKGIEDGEHFMIYPSGRLKRTGKEIVGGASFVHSLIQVREKIPCVLIRTTGLWGSSFSVARTGSSPHFGSTLVRALWMVVKNFFFFVPKRDIKITFAVNPSLPRQKDRLEFNRALEDWYNQYPGKEEPLSLISESFWSDRVEVCSMEDKDSEKDEGHWIISQGIETKVIAYLAELSKIPEEKILRDSELSADLGLDSLNIAEIHAFLDKQYDAAQVPLGELKKVRDVLRAIAQKDKYPKKNVEAKKSLQGWLEKKRKELEFASGNHIAEVFLRNSQRMGSAVACADDLSGVLSYHKMRIAVLILAEEFRGANFSGERVAVLLPSSSGTYIVILALLLAGKVPVMLNWTLGQKALNHIVKIGDFSLTLTSKRFLDRIHLAEVGDVEATFAFLEDIKESLSFRKKSIALLRSFFSTKTIVQKIFPLDRDPETTAVVLFTSGSEADPKGVPLSHKNILENQRALLCHAKLTAEDSIYGVLPPFHSFGFSLTGLLPLLCGLKVFYAPDPTDSFSVAADIEDKKLTLLCLAPSFLSLLFSTASVKQLESLTLVVSGAEKPSSSVLGFVQQKLPWVEWLEGYGITECAPVVTTGIRGRKENQGVGRPLPGVEIILLDVDTKEPVACGETGEIYINGPNVFAGYIGDNQKTFYRFQGKTWYPSGDLGRIDDFSNLHIVERIKRTIKIGGEMISLGAVEQEVKDIARREKWDKPGQEEPFLAVIADVQNSLEHPPELILFTLFPVDVEEVNRLLRESGLARLVKISRVIEVPAIPLTGTGKTQYRELQEQVKKSVKK